MLQKKKLFKQKKDYCYSLMLKTLAFFVTIWLFEWIFFSSEQFLLDHFGSQELIGSSGQREAQVLEMLVVNNFGKSGMVIMTGVLVLGTLYYLIKEFREFKRFLKRDKLYKQGLVNNFEDNYMPVTLFQAIRNLFKPKMKRIKEYPSEKYMLKSLEKNKYFK